MKTFIKYLKSSKTSIILLILISAIISGFTFAIPIFTQIVFDRGIMNGDTYNIILFSLLLIAVYIARSIISYYNDFLLSKTGNKIIANVKSEIIEKVINMPMTFFDHNSTAYILSRINEVNSLSSVFSSSVFNFFSSIITMIAAIIFIFVKSWILGLACLAFIPLVYYISKGSMDKIFSSSKEIFEQNAKTNNEIHNSLEGVLTLKQLNQEEKINKLISHNVSVLSQKTVIQQKNTSMSTQLMIMSIAIVQVLLMALIGFLIIRDQLKLSDYISLTQYIGYFYTPVTIFQTVKILTQPSRAAILRIDSMLSERIPERIGIKIDAIKSVELSNLSFKYKDETNVQPVLENVNLKLYPGEKLALIGPNGSGKTTIIKLILGFYDDYNGDIIINQINQKEIDSKSLRDLIGLIPQNVFLFEKTIRENIRIGNDNLSEDEFDKRLHDLINYGFLSNIDLDMPVIENGKNLSKGQVQQIAILRTLIRSADVIVFDEATTSLDQNSQRALDNYLDKNAGGKICIFITHNNEYGSIINKKMTLSLHTPEKNGIVTI